MAFPYGDIETAIRDHYLPQVVDNIFNSNAILKILLGKAKEQDGGLKLRVPVMYGRNTEAEFYSGYELLGTNQPAIIDTALYPWVQATVPINISGRDEMMNTGPDGIVDLIETRMSNAESSLKYLFTTKMFAAANANAATEITSLNDIVAADPTIGIGGIDSSDYSWWAPFTALASGAANLSELRTVTDEDHLLLDMATQFRGAADGSDTPDLLVTTDDVMSAYESIVGAQARWEGNGRLADAGWTVFRYKGAEMVSDKECTAGMLYFLNTRYLYFKVHPQRNFSFAPFLENRNQDAKVARIYWMGQFVCSQRRRQTALTSIPSS